MILCREYNSAVVVVFFNYWKKNCYLSCLEDSHVIFGERSFRESAPEQVSADVSVAGAVLEDVGVVPSNAKEILPTSIQAKPEEGELTQKLIPTLSDAEIEEVSNHS